MDPDAALCEISDNLGTFWNPSTPKDTRLAIAEHIIQHVQALHEWLLKGGHLPSDWEVGERASIPVINPGRDVRVTATRKYGPFAPNRLQCPCECNSGGFCGGCGHAGCGGR